MDSTTTVETVRSEAYQNPPTYDEVARMTNLNNADLSSEWIKVAQIQINLIS